MTSNNKLIVFDVDGTLLNSRYAYLKALSEVWEDVIEQEDKFPDKIKDILKNPVKQRQFEESRGLEKLSVYSDFVSNFDELLTFKINQLNDEEIQDYDSEDFYDDFCSALDVNFSDPNSVIANFQSIYDEALEEYGGLEAQRMYDGMEQLLHTLKEEGYELAIFSSRRNETALDSMPEEIADIFDYVVGTGGNKYANQLIDIIDKTNGSKETTIVIGDGNGEFYAAKEADVKFMYPSWGFEILPWGETCEVLESVDDAYAKITAFFREKEHSVSNDVGPFHSATILLNPDYLGPLDADLSRHR